MKKIIKAAGIIEKFYELRRKKLVGVLISDKGEIRFRIFKSPADHRRRPEWKDARLYEAWPGLCKVEVDKRTKRVTVTRLNKSGELEAGMESDSLRGAHRHRQHLLRPLSHKDSLRDPLELQSRAVGALCAICKQMIPGRKALGEDKFRFTRGPRKGQVVGLAKFIQALQRVAYVHASCSAKGVVPAHALHSEYLIKFRKLAWKKGYRMQLADPTLRRKRKPEKKTGNLLYIQLSGVSDSGELITREYVKEQ